MSWPQAKEKGDVPVSITEWSGAEETNEVVAEQEFDLGRPCRACRERWGICQRQEGHA